ncbi:DUF6261 family protein [Flavobacterium sp.]|uniref:DUF6261 family protein n=1 Tax=Flavobacterium sp. TaxID=239 RepID=UPI00286D8589|nr:DUF6261 family protein [Flavobacterium sp.]
MIDSIDLQLLRNDEHLQLNKDVATLTLQNDPQALKIKPQYDALVLKNNELDGLYKKQAASELTQELIALDDRRDRAISGLVVIADGYQYHFEPAMSQAGIRLSANFKLYGAAIARQNLQSETNILSSIANDLEQKPELVAAITTLGLTAWKNELKTANSLFGAKYLERTVQYSEVTKETLAAKREETNQVYYKLRQHIEANATLDESNVGYTKLINQINALIKQYKLVLEKRKKNEEVPTPDVPPSA